jgi:hypothetical protein
MIREEEKRYKYLLVINYKRRRESMRSIQVFRSTFISYVIFKPFSFGLRDPVSMYELHPRLYNNHFVLTEFESWPHGRTTARDPRSEKTHRGFIIPYFPASRTLGCELIPFVASNFRFTF